LVEGLTKKREISRNKTGCIKNDTHILQVLPSVNPNIANIALEQYSYDGQVKEINRLIQILYNLININIKLSKKEGKVNAKEKNISRLLQLIRRIEKIE